MLPETSSKWAYQGLDLPAPQHTSYQQLSSEQQETAWQAPGEISRPSLPTHTHTHTQGVIEVFALRQSI